MREIPNKYWICTVYVILTAATLAVFWQVHAFDFVNYDDDKYVSENKHILTGLTLSNITWAFGEPHFFMWHPMTSLSHMLDCQLFGLNPGWHHTVSLLFHIVNALLLFTVLRRMTDRIWPSAFVAAVFALHPLNVESVAWVAERKSVLSGFFWILTMFTYVRYAKRPGIVNYLLVVLVFSLALMSKPITVTLPFALLLLDYWPLNRLENVSLTQASSRRTIFRLILEKIPLFILSALCSTITFLAQRSGGTIIELKNLPLRFRLANAVFSYLKYIGKMFWPTELTAFYPFKSEELSSVWVWVALAFFLVVSIIVVQLAKTCKYLPVGWFWYLGTLIPTIGIVQAGSQAMADRYAYVPLIGLFIIIAWGANDLLMKWRYRKIILRILAFAVLIVLTICTKFQVRYWQDSLALWEHALQITENEPSAHYHLAAALAQKGRFEEAAEHGRVALELRKTPNAEILSNMGSIYNNLGRYTEAIEAFVQALKVDPSYANAYVGLGNTFGKLGYHKEAEQAAKQAIKIEPDLAEAYSILGAAYFSQNDWTDAIETFRQAIRMQPDYAQAHYSLGLALLRSGDKNAALKQYQILKKLDAEKANMLLGLIQK